MTVTIQDDGAVRIIAIDRPEVRNAVNPATARALFAAFRDFEADQSSAVAILTGTGGAFCAGYDLKAAATGDGGSWLGECAIPEDWTDPVARPIPGPMGPSRLMLSKPVIAAIEGHAVAGGMELALWCDLRVMARDAVMGIYCRRWGVPLIDGGTVRLTGRPVDAAEAQAMGLADRVAEPGNALVVAVDLAHGLARFPQACMRADHLSARMPPADLAAALRREWVSAAAFEAEGRAGAARFSGGRGRGGSFEDL
jgi:enoyl-CoA hydratase